MVPATRGAAILVPLADIHPPGIVEIIDRPGAATWTVLTPQFVNISAGTRSLLDAATTIIFWESGVSAGMIVISERSMSELSLPAMATKKVL